MDVKQGSGVSVGSVEIISVERAKTSMHLASLLNQTHVLLVCISNLYIPFLSGTEKSIDIHAFSFLTLHLQTSHLTYYTILKLGHFNIIWNFCCDFDRKLFCPPLSLVRAHFLLHVTLISSHVSAHVYPCNCPCLVFCNFPNSHLLFPLLQIFRFFTSLLLFPFYSIHSQL